MDNIISIDERIYWENLSDECRNKEIDYLKDKHFVECYNNTDSKICENGHCYHKARYKVKTSENKILYSCEKHKDDIGENFTYFGNDFENYMHKETREIEPYYRLRRSGALIKDYIKLTEEEMISYATIMLIRHAIRTKTNHEKWSPEMKKIAEKYDEIFAADREIYFDKNILKIVRDSIIGQKDFEMMDKGDEEIVDYLSKL